MNNCTGGMSVAVGGIWGEVSPVILASAPSLTHWVTAPELDVLRTSLARGALPADFEGKLSRMAGGDLTNYFIAQNCRLFAALLCAHENGDFRKASLPEREHLLRVLAYVRKDEDAVPDYRPGGFKDDQQEVRAATMALAGLLQAFKAWRLQHGVPGIWPPCRNAGL